jgi:predicted transcriptional regulator
VDIYFRLEQHLQRSDSAEAGDWSQMPVVDNGNLVALLTAGTIARWFGSLSHGAETKSTTVRQVLDHTQHPDQHWQIVSKDISMGEALEAFIAATSEGYGLDAVVINHAGWKDQKPMGIVTVGDIPQLAESVGSIGL